MGKDGLIRGRQRTDFEGFGNLFSSFTIAEPPTVGPVSQELNSATPTFWWMGLQALLEDSNRNI
ncbi:MAG: hypothetical protein R2788_21075 [Saprospiraceae bacterium]